jgi:dihydrofolate reductase
VGRLVYAAITSLDGYVVDEEGEFGWARPDEEVLRSVNELERPVGTYLYGRPMYETMVFWETAEAEGGQPDLEGDFARIWRAADKIVYSTTLAAVASGRTTLVREFDPDAVRRMKAAASSDLTVGGADLAGQAIRAGLVDECHQFVTPVVVGGGPSWLPDHVRFPLQLLDEHRFGNGVVHLHYRMVDERI